MAAEPARHLRVVDEHGQLHDECPGCRERSIQIKMLERDIAGKRLRIANLEADANAKAREHELWPTAVRLFDFWKERTGHPRCEFTAERFDLVLPHLRDLGEKLCRRAIEGIAYDPFTKVRKNGSLKRYDDWGLLWRSREKVEEFANRAPYHLPSPEAVKIVADALMFLRPELEPHEAVHEARQRLI